MKPPKKVIAPTILSQYQSVDDLAEIVAC